MIRLTEIVVSAFVALTMCNNSIAQTAGFTFTTDYGADSVWRTALDGTGAMQIVSGLRKNVSGVVADVGASKIYFLEAGSVIRTANFDGTGFATLFTLPDNDAYDLQFDAQNAKLYWSDVSTGFIYRANLDGTAVEAFSVGPYVNGIAVDAQHGKLYWAHTSGNFSLFDGTISRSNLDGSDVETLVSGINYPNIIRLDVANGHMYWTQVFRIMRADLDGNNVTTLVSGEGASGLALDLVAGKMYWTREEGFSTGRANLDGSNVETFLSGLSRPVSVVVVDPRYACSALTAISSNFNGTRIGAGNSIWFNSNLNVSGLGSDPVTITFTGQTVTSSNFTVALPDSSVTFDPAATIATTTYGNGMWATRVPSYGLAGNDFLSGGSYLVPVGGLPGGIKSVTWQGVVATSAPGVKLNWKWGAATYTMFGSDPNQLGVKPVDDNKASQYKNSDHAGTPEALKSFVVGGATGGGGSNYTGGWSGTASVVPTCAQ